MCLRRLIHLDSGRCIQLESVLDPEAEPLICMSECIFFERIVWKGRYLCLDQHTIRPCIIYKKPLSFLWITRDCTGTQYLVFSKTGTRIFITKNKEKLQEKHLKLLWLEQWFSFRTASTDFVLLQISRCDHTNVGHFWFCSMMLNDAQEPAQSGKGLPSRTDGRGVGVGLRNIGGGFLSVTKYE